MGAETENKDPRTPKGTTIIQRMRNHFIPSPNLILSPKIPHKTQKSVSRK